MTTEAAQKALTQFHERKNEVTSQLQDLADIAQGLGAKTIKEKIGRDLVRKLVEDRFHLVVVGEFNHGKTTFVNALLGKAVLPVGVTPTTAAIHHIRYADAPEATVVFTSGKREALPFEDVPKFAVGGGRGDDETVDFLEVGYPAPLLKERILLVDTPGVNDLSLQRADITYSYIPRADAVLFLLDAGQILKESERVFLEDKLLKASRDKIVFVITKWDILSAEEQATALEYAKTQLAKLVRDPVVFPVSAETALGGKADESGMPELLAHLTRFLAEERGRILLDNALGEGLNVVGLLAKGVDARRRSVEMKSEELERRIELLERDLQGQAGTIEERRIQIKQDIAGIKVGARKDLDRFVDDVIRQLPAVIDNAKGDEIKQYLPAFLEDTFKTWAEQETKEVAAKLEELAEKTIAMIRADAEETSKRVTLVLGGDVKRLDVQIDTLAYDIGVTALFAVGLGALFVNLMVGGLLLVAAPITAMVFKGRIEGEYKNRAKELAPDVVRQAAARIGPKMDEIIDDFAQKLDAWVVQAGEELHREVLEVLQAAMAAKSAGAVDQAATLVEIDAQDRQLAAARTRIEATRAALWEPEEKVRIAAEAVPSPT
jgi:small GTP-binding protein